jgi:hypothetical protein
VFFWVPPSYLASPEAKNLVFWLPHAHGGLVGELVLAEHLLFMIAEAVATVEALGDLFRRHDAVGVGDRFVEGEAARADLVGEVECAHALRDIELRAPGLPRLGGDDDDAVGGLGAVDRRRRGALQHLDALDVVRVEIADAIDAVVLRRRVGARGGAEDGVGARLEHVVADDDAVHHVERIGGAVDGGHAAEAHLHAAARGAGVRVDLRAGDLALEGVLDGGRGRAVELLSGDDRDVVRRVDVGDARRRAGHDLGLELQDVALEGDVRFGRVGGHRDVLAAVADAPDAKRHGAGRDVQCELSLVIRQRADGSADDEYLRAVDGLVGARAGHAAGESPLCFRASAA